MIGPVLSILGAVGMAVALLSSWANTPVVYKSWSTQECVEVLSPREQDSCENLPEKYELVWRK